MSIGTMFDCQTNLKSGSSVIETRGGLEERARMTTEDETEE
jgi:hypothetical protein